MQSIVQCKYRITTGYARSDWEQESCEARRTELDAYEIWRFCGIEAVMSTE